MGQGQGVREVGYIDCPGGGQVVVKRGIAYVGNMRAPEGTMIVDVRDPKNPKTLSILKTPVGTHSHKVRVEGDIMVINREVNPFQPGAPADYKGGLGIYDVSKPSEPRLITQWETEGMGVHRFDFDGRYAYISPTAKGYVGNIVMILDLADPAKPERSDAGGCRGSGSRAARRRAGKALTVVAIIRCGWEIVCTRAIGMAAS